MRDEVTQYAYDVVHGDLRKVCCKWEILACQRHLRDMELSQSPDYPYIFDITRARRFFTHMTNIRRVDDTEQHIVLRDWQMFDDGCIFGWVTKDTGKRRFKRAYRRIARGHAKTTNAAGVGLYTICGDALYPPYHPELAKFEQEPLVQICAVDRQQGKIAWSDISTMAQVNPQFARRLEIKKTYIRNKQRGGGVEVLSKDTKNKDGQRPSVIILEEWHAHPTSKVRDKAASGMGKKWQCLEYIITTAGTDAENKPCYKDDLYCKMILEGQAEQDDIFIMIREIDDEDDPHDKSCWVKANPFFRQMDDYSKTLYEQVCSEHDNAYNQNDLDKIREFLIKRMDRWQSDSENKYFTGCMDKFKQLGVSQEEFLQLTTNSRGWYGFDLGKTTDLTGIGYVTLLKDGRIAVWVHGFMPQNRATEHEHSDKIPYKQWAEKGWITLTPGDVTDNSYVQTKIAELEKENGWRLNECCYDGHNAVDLAIRMGSVYGEHKIIEIAQTCAGLNQATKSFRDQVLMGNIVHDGSPLLYWCLSNAVEVKNNYGDIKLSKRHKDDSQRIDPVAAMINALARAIIKFNKTKNINDIIQKRGYAIQ